MSQIADEARAARIQKYKEERRKQLTARTATLFSANVTERRPRKAASRTPLEDAADNQKSSSELNLNTASTSVPIRTTRTSRLRAAAANNTDSCQLTRKSNRSSSVQSLLDDDKVKTPKNSKIVDRDKSRLNSVRRQSHEKENLKSASTSCFPDKDNGAIRSKLKHSNNKNILEKDKLNFLVTSPKEKNVDQKNSLKLDKKKRSVSDETKIAKGNDRDTKDKGKDEDVLNSILGEKKSPDDVRRDTFDELYNNLIDGGEIVPNIEIELDTADDTLQPLWSQLNSSQEKQENPLNRDILVGNVIEDNNVRVENGAVPKVIKNEMGLLGAVCVRKVERFSELLSNLCSPCDADILFEDILVESGIDGDKNSVSSKKQ